MFYRNITETETICYSTNMIVYDLLFLDRYLNQQT